MAQSEFVEILRSRLTKLLSRRNTPCQGLRTFADLSGGKYFTKMLYYATREQNMLDTIGRRNLSLTPPEH
jgi:hypothetical protein